MKNPLFENYLLATASSGEILDALVSVMEQPEDSRDDAQWVKWAMEFLDVYIPFIVWRRQCDGLVLNVESFKKNWAFENLIDFSSSPRVPKDIRESLWAYLMSLEAFSRIETYSDRDDKFYIARIAHSYRTNYFLKPLSYLTGQKI